MLKVLVDSGFQIVEPCPQTLFCLLEFDGQRLTTSHVPIQNGRAKFNEEAEFNVKKGGSLRVQLCSVDAKPGLLSLDEHKLFGRAKHPIAYDLPNQSVQVLHDLELRSKSGKPRARMKLTLTIPPNPNALPTREQPKTPREKAAGNPFHARNGAFSSPRSSGAGSRNSLDSAGFETNQSSMVFDEVSPDFGGNRRRAPHSSDSMVFENSKFNPSQSLTSIDDIQEHEPESKVTKRDKKGKNANKSVRNTIIGGIGLTTGIGVGAFNNNKEKHKQKNASSTGFTGDQLQIDKLQAANKLLTEALKSRDKEIKELNTYIESLLVKVMAKSPDLLQS